MKQRLCTTHSNNYDELKRVIIDTLKQECLNYIDKKKVKEKVLNSNEINIKNNYQNEINSLKNEIHKINTNLDNVYIDKLNKVIDENMFNRIKLKLELEKCVNQFLSMKKPSRELIVNLVEKVIIYKDKSIDINVTFKN